MYWMGSYRVNGQLAISRAIGDPDYKPFVTGDPEIACIPLDGDEDFLILACDGLWDHVTEDDASINVYRQVRENPGEFFFKFLGLMAGGVKKLITFID